ncbi:hypothetical protein [Bradyrhizobium tropiciagri]|uniref:hypothetical protein n=1 Tax=Bradyrhizobium tropiciagri TaxID=312253 RepID=UPI00067BBB99|nr:hypothetical protein [Bradyrhizobium tropiciagri]
MLEHIIKFMTLVSDIVGVVAIYTALHTNNRRLGADIYLRYSDRISDLRRALPITAFVELGAAEPRQMTSEERRTVHEIIYSIFELYELKLRGFLPPAIWRIREPDIERLLSLSMFRAELKVLQGRFDVHPRFRRWLEQTSQTRT